MKKTRKNTDPQYTFVREYANQIEELNASLNKFKRRKVPGPDEEAMEIYQILDQENRYRLLEIINEWWNKSELPEEKLLSRIFFIYKKDNPSNILNYRPIALTSSLYNFCYLYYTKKNG